MRLVSVRETGTGVIESRPSNSVHRKDPGKHDGQATHDEEGVAILF